MRLDLGQSYVDNVGDDLYEEGALGQGQAEDHGQAEGQGQPNVRATHLNAGTAHSQNRYGTSRRRPPRLDTRHRAQAGPSREDENP